MKSLRHFIVKVEKRFNDTINIGDKEFYLDPKFNEFEHRIAYGEIVSPPLNFDTGAKIGDTLFFHHHVIMAAPLSIGNGMYICEYDEKNPHTPDHAIAYRSKESKKLKMLNDWVFVEPVFGDGGDVKTDSGIIVEVSKEKVRANVARVMVTNKDIEWMGVKPGDIVGFDKNSDYKIKLDDGTIAYRMRADDLSYVEEQ